MMVLRSLCALTVMLALSACGGVAARHDVRSNLVEKAGWQSGLLKAGKFDIAASWSPVQRGENLFVYLEGDGLAYVNAYRPAKDPTPDDPVALRMAINDIHATGASAQPVLYLARPCQYTLPDDGANCNRKYWTIGRYAPEITDSISNAIDQIKQRVGARHIVLVGYSGGGALAVLLAGQRADIAGIITVVGNLDLAYWTKRDGLTPLSASTDPVTMAHDLGDTPQLHLAGGQDDAVGPDVTRAYMQALPASSPANMLVFDHYDHQCCWAQDWQKISQWPEFSRIPYWHGK
ncbi:alpha/beta hydrolase family protein [Thalassospira marina]|uniref:Alpha/beta hydrolase n=1 Tax=Thalassospira marina TaxID=2048283 RepID=A0A2N3KMT2_9PROT|nr:hypothetical protein [Thalassospira marina]PKR51861.1 hypothetical protein COO20_18660 [Thalassospira marina]